MKYETFRGHSEHGSQKFYSLLRLYAITLPSLPANSASFFTLYLLPLNEYFESYSFTVSIMRVRASLVF